MILCLFKKTPILPIPPWLLEKYEPLFLWKFRKLNLPPLTHAPAPSPFIKGEVLTMRSFVFPWIFDYKETSNFSWKVKTMLREGRSETSIAWWLYVLDREHFSSHYVQFKRRISSEFCYLYFSTMSSIFGKSVGIRKKCENTIQVTYLDHFCEIIWRPSDKSGQPVWISMFLRACSFSWDYGQITLVYQSPLPGCGYNWSNCSATQYAFTQCTTVR